MPPIDARIDQWVELLAVACPLGGTIDFRVPRIVSGTRKYDRGLTQLLHTKRHWLDVADWVT